MSSKRLTNNILINSEFVKDIESKGNISAFHTLYLTRDVVDRQRVISEEDSSKNGVEINLKSDEDIFEFVSNEKYHKNKNSRSGIEQARSELVNENLIAIDISRKILGEKGANFTYKNYYFLVVLYSKDNEDLSNLDEEEELSNKNYIRVVIDNDYVYYKIGFMMVVDTLGYLHSSVDNILYFSLDPFNVNVKFNGINKPKSTFNREFLEAFEHPIFNHFHKSVDKVKESMSGANLLEPYNTSSVISSAIEQGLDIDYFYNYINESKEDYKLNKGLYIYEENIIYADEENKNYTTALRLNERSFRENENHQTKGGKEELFYSLDEKSIFDDETINFPTNQEGDVEYIEFLIDSRKKKDSILEIKLGLLINDDVKIYWDFHKNKNDFQIVKKEDIDIGEVYYKYTQSDTDNYKIVRVVGNVGTLYLSDSFLGHNKIKEIAINCSQLEHNDLSLTEKNSSIERIFLYKANKNFPFKLSFFSSLFEFEDNYNGEIFGFTGKEDNEFFADSNSNNIKNYTRSTFPSIISAKNLFSGWNKIGDFTFVSNILNITSFDNLISNSKYLNKFTFENNGSSVSESPTTFVDSFKNDQLLTSVILPSSDIIVSNASGMFENCLSLTTIKNTNETVRNIISFNTTGNSIANRIFKNTPSLGDIEFKIYPTSLVEAFKGSGIESFNYSSNRCEDFTGALSNCENLLSINIDLNSAQKIGQLIENSININSIVLKNLSCPLSLDTITKDVNNKEYDYAIGLNRDVDISDFELNYSHKILFSPMLRMGKNFDLDIVSNIIGLEDNINCGSIIYPIIDVSMSDNDVLEFYSNKDYYNNSKFYFYTNPHINNFIYVNVKSDELRTGYNWNSFTLPMGKNDVSSLTIGDTDDNNVIYLKGVNSGFKIELENIASISEEYSYTFDENNCYKEENLVKPNSVFFNKVLDLGAIDILFGASHREDKSHNKDFPTYIKIYPNSKKDLSVIFFVGIKNKTIKKENYSIDLLLDEDENKESSKNIDFVRFKDNSYNKIDCLIEDEYSYENVENSINFSSNKKCIVMFNLSSLSTESIAVFKLSGNYCFNGFIIADPSDVKDMLRE